MAARVGIGKDAVAKIWADDNLRPWKVTTFKISNDPRFEEKLVDVVGLYLNPPERAVVFCFDEKTQCQALDRTQPSLPMKPGRAGTMTHDYKRHGTIDLFAAMNVATGEVLTDLRTGHTGADVLRFFKQIDASASRAGDSRRPGQPVRALDAADHGMARAQPPPLASSPHPDVEFLAEPRRAMVQGTDDKRLRRGIFTSLADLTDAITTWAEHWNENPKPFVWKATAEDIIAKVRRGRDALHQVKKQTEHQSASSCRRISPRRLRSMKLSATSRSIISRCSMSQPSRRLTPNRRSRSWLTNLQ